MFSLTLQIEKFCWTTSWYFPKNKDHVKLKGLRRGAFNKLYRQLKLRGKLGELLLLDISEYNTSKTCNPCREQDLKNLKVGAGEDVYYIHQILFCKKCNIFWNRDVMAAKNMYAIATSIWNGDGCPNVSQSIALNVVTTSRRGGVKA
ncbi:hypothetical protein RMATCC62417_14186 [Rhizopus microsporus]|nr:hypothetical protein RMATCC62417_14186 [Rhizopus microsporus]